MKRKVTNCRNFGVQFLPVGLVTCAVTQNNPPHFCMGVPKLLFSLESRCIVVHSSYFNSVNSEYRPIALSTQPS